MYTGDTPTVRTSGQTGDVKAIENPLLGELRTRRENFGGRNSQATLEQLNIGPSGENDVPRYLSTYRTINTIVLCTPGLLV